MDRCGGGRQFTLLFFLRFSRCIEMLLEREVALKWHLCLRWLSNVNLVWGHKLLSSWYDFPLHDSPKRRFISINDWNYSREKASRQASLSSGSLRGWLWTPLAVSASSWMKATDARRIFFPRWIISAPARRKPGSGPTAPARRRHIRSKRILYWHRRVPPSLWVCRCCLHHLRPPLLLWLLPDLHLLLVRCRCQPKSRRIIPWIIRCITHRLIHGTAPSINPSFPRCLAEEEGIRHPLPFPVAPKFIRQIPRPTTTKTPLQLRRQRLRAAVLTRLRLRLTRRWVTPSISTLNSELRFATSSSVFSPLQHPGPLWGITLLTADWETAGRWAIR